MFNTSYYSNCFSPVTTKCLLCFLMPTVSFADISKTKPSFSLVQPNAYHRKLDVHSYGFKKLPSAIMRHLQHHMISSLRLNLKHPCQVRRFVILGKQGLISLVLITAWLGSGLAAAAAARPNGPKTVDWKIWTNFTSLSASSYLYVISCVHRFLPCQGSGRSQYQT